MSSKKRNQAVDWRTNEPQTLSSIVRSQSIRLSCSAVLTVGCSSLNSCLDPLTPDSHRPSNTLIRAASGWRENQKSKWDCKYFFLDSARDRTDKRTVVGKTRRPVTQLVVGAVALPSYSADLTAFWSPCRVNRFLPSLPQCQTRDESNLVSTLS